ncbi:Histone-lysine N-methyltransferase SETD2 [Heterocephalus glaber]|uniref:Histone-lysine N-methyltransferase SETD2 n=1 Tax=Heterocephalus glaber TaxID=10181 RepID=G5C0L9_HETGA|nr:Histone-lysine N-methyltransferase SETD2 [Heterocephalus glaber]
MREEENEAKTESVQKTGFIKGPVLKGVASSRFLPKGPKTKVNLEEQGRQKVSFSFSLTKKLTTPPIVQIYAQAILQYIQGQQIFTAHPQAVVIQPTAAVTTLVTPGQPQPLQPLEMVVTNNLLDLPPPSSQTKNHCLTSQLEDSPRSRREDLLLPCDHKADSVGSAYLESPGDDASLEYEAEIDLRMPTYDENPMKTSKKPKTEEEDTSSELAKKSKEVFRKEMSQFIVQCLNPYWTPDCKVGRITTTDDFNT